MRASSLVLLLVAGLFVGCEAAGAIDGKDAAGMSADVKGTAAPDATSSSGTDAGSERADAAVVDTGVGSGADASAADAGGPADDAATAPADAATSPDAELGRDATGADAAARDATAPDATAPDATAPDATAADAMAPDAGDPCAAVSCAQVPPPTCVGNTTLRTYSGAGTCTTGQCVYPSNDTTCSDRCSQGACVVLTCGATRCDTPPGPACVDAQTLRRAAPIGSCEAATMTCGYTTADSICSQGCAGTACAPGSWLATRVDDNGDYPAIAVDPLDQPHVVFFHGTELRVASRSDRGWSTTTVDSNLSPTNAMIAADGSGGLHVVYDEVQNHNVRYAYRAYGAATYSVEFVATAGDVYPFALGIDAQGVPTVVYLDRTNGQARAARRIGPGTWTVTHSMPSGGQYARGKLQFGPAGEPYLAYAAWRIRGTTATVNAALATPTANSWTEEVLPAKYLSGFVRTARGEAHVLLSDLTTGITAHHRSPAGVWTQEAVDALNSTSSSLTGDLAIDAAGVLHVGYYRYVLRTTNHGLSHATYANGAWTLEHVYEAPSLFDGAGVAMTLGPSGAVHFAAVVSTTSDLFHVSR
jgi:hypothetical protein